MADANINITLNIDDEKLKSLIEDALIRLGIIDALEEQDD